jgi:hypothetical protein
VRTLGKWKRTQRGLILIQGIFFARCKLSTLRDDMLRARASSKRFSSVASVAAELSCVF